MDVDVVRNWTAGPIVEDYDASRTILYALGLGIRPEGSDLDYVYEKRLQAVPTMAVMIANEGFWLQDPRTGVDWSKILHGAQGLELYRPLPATGRLVGHMKVDAVIDRGEGKGATIIYSRTLTDPENGETVAVVRATIIARGDGGFGESSGTAELPHPMPDGAPDLSAAIETRPDLAAIYRLSGDFNPLHIDPDFARKAGFERPILHGLCSYGIAARAAIGALCDGDPGRLRRFDARFSAPVFAGDTLVTEMWREGDGQAAFRVRAAERDQLVLSNGLVRWN
ncbi:MaoC/PaaZ C-terminal domain-containing protein [Rhizorhabdus dicambivorans]|uniref:3-alpha,7-alpha, 12-alpha-trihydroxy-5-beta-cholest-24-enoyl-CoA hydratase n=1 Tax=Rhizorhabdus dicambivorans TaxID=1850238 RepID=A0A2A4FU66_9SPHN|nr:MaoC/PaaZ C-terminal domain-containing protein [Rhizorhabdus dicambivorans]ATE66206.1 3-alpha,7-alpha,12-alpha-trihydroxy-5-beta-cholest-24-enoyl-CoA hydratase [Rhizorhabdus dicambivorans]PCE41717.1 3-alpha,7-alpha,12-alpha-trihydroxy-5-beta-cholest-24-enoyl-CoA hydratase [Rhizorhabdus dicambivorans]